jgi:hypothetical protein
MSTNPNVSHEPGRFELPERDTVSAPLSDHRES